MFIIWASGFKIGTSCSVRYTGPIKFMARVFLKAIISILVDLGFSKITAALLIKMSSGFFKEVILLTQSSIFLRFAKLSFKKIRLECVKLATPFFDVPITKYPSDKNFCARAFPIPRLAPVMRTVFVLNFR